ncbi:hypothetical protein FPQ18DRAFT_382103 [Pyronema domesticum]|uniref:Uncharacterized protein n=1 Tax=Pyronema omphalodes (strain CBS 100304) TaxID=1076935 RepID=U4LDV5_PYROM|nr:hypothetical protein FPQ18DRAFT_382103 [Pyronema domesticum]CCX30048.1 Similar to conserved hypothetical protein [Pyrenophora tritici-repentis Pt-1C-BFP]; acc. no. XP_001937305 [Pyronema omphalodes CBS 100304]
MKVPAITTNPPDTAERLKRKKSTMATERPPAKVPPNPSTPVLPRVRTTRNPTPSSLHPNVTTRSPKAAPRKPRSDTVTAPPDMSHQNLSPRPYIARPSSAASNRSFASNATYNGNSSRMSQPNINPTNGSSMFFHAGQTGYHDGPTTQPTYNPAPTSAPKFFHADGAPSVMTNGDLLPRRPYRASMAGSTVGSAVGSAVGSHIGSERILAPSPASRAFNPSPPSSRPSSIVGQHTVTRSASMIMSKPHTPLSTPTAPPSTRAHVKFVYANGAEELSPPREYAGSATSSPQLQQSPFPGAINTSPSKSGFPMSPLGSPGLSSPPHYFQRQGSHSRKSSADLQRDARKARTVSVSSMAEVTVAPQTDEEHSEADNEDDQSSSHSSSEEISESESEDDDEPEEAPPPPPMTAAERIKMMEDRAANSRRERKVMDLEISNASLLAINKTLEREMRKQSAELRRYKRLARTGTLASISKTDLKTKSGIDSAIDTEAATIEEGSSDYSLDSEPSTDTETEKLSEEASSNSDVSGDESANDEKHRAADEKRLAADLSKHQALLDASTKMNKSLHCCLLVTDQLIKEGKKALEYSVKPSDVRIGGRVLIDEDETTLDSVDVSAAEETEDEHQTDVEHETEEEGEEDEEDDELTEEEDYYEDRFDGQEEETIPKKLFIPPERLRELRYGMA